LKELNWYKQAKERNIIDMAVVFACMMPLFQGRSADLIKEKLTELFKDLDRIGSEQGFRILETTRQENVAMPLKENLKTKIKVDRLFQNLVSTMKEPPGRRWLDKGLTKELLAMTDFEHKRVRDLDLYLSPLEGEMMEVAVLDNELPIYHTTVADVTLRKSPYWQQMFSIRNVRKIMNDHDVIASKGKESLKRLHANALALLDLTYTRDDLDLLLENARQGLEQKSISQIQESFDLFFELVHFQPLSLEGLAQDLRIFARRKVNGSPVPTFEDLILFKEEDLSLGLKRETFSPQSDSDLAWVMQYARGEKSADLQGMDVFEFLAELALEKAQAQRGENRTKPST
jgi:hypothetical protein